MVSGTKVYRASPSANSECIPADPPISSVTQSTVTCCDRHTIAVVLSAGCALAAEGPRLHRLHRTGQAVLFAHRRELRDTAPKMAASDLRSPRPAPRSRWRGQTLRSQRLAIPQDRNPPAPADDSIPGLPPYTSGDRKSTHSNTS